MKYKVVIFDLDGTLINSIDGIAYSMNNVLRKHGLSTYDRETYKTFVGNGTLNLVRKAVGDMSINEESKYFIEMKNEYSINWDYNMHVYDGIEEVIKYLDRLKIKYAVNTNKDEKVAKYVVDKYLGKYNFEIIVGDNFNRPIKPDPTGAYIIAKKLEAKPKECIFIGDSEVDIMTANNANMFSVGALWGFRKRDDLEVNKVDLLINHPSELLNYLKNYL